MPRYKVIEIRAYKSGMLIDAADEDAAKRGDGEIVYVDETDSWGHELVSIEEVSDDQDEELTCP